MTVQIAESKIKLRSIVTSTNLDGTMKRGSISVSNINERATNELLYNLAKAIANLTDGSFAGAVKAKDDYLEEIE